MKRKIRSLTTQLERSHDIIHTHEQMDKSKNAQLVIQHAELQKLKQTIIAKGEKMKEKHTTVFKRVLVGI